MANQNISIPPGKQASINVKVFDAGNVPSSFAPTQKPVKSMTECAASLLLNMIHRTAAPSAHNPQ